jgi:hypothetical protein
MGFGQFSPNILPLQEQANAVRVCERIGILQQLGQGGQSPRGHHIESPGRQVFQTGIPDRGFCAGAVRDGLEKSAFLGRGFVQGHG